MGMTRQIVFLTTGLAYGGAETQLVNLVTNLSEREWEVRVVSMLPPQAFTDELESARIATANLNMRRGVPDPRAILNLVILLRRWRPSILTSFMFHANLLGRVAGHLANVPVIVSSIRNENFGGPRREWLLRITDWMADITTTNSRLAADKLITRRVVPRNRIRVIPNGLMLNKFTGAFPNRSQLRRQTSVADDEFLWLAVGRLDEQKDYPTLLRAFQLLRHGGYKARLQVAGQGPLLSKLKRQVADLRIDDYVMFLGLRHDIPLLLNAADGFVLSSAWEGLPNVVMESMAAGRPVVATRVGGVPELIEDGVNGYLVDPGNAVALAAAMKKIMSLSEAERKAMGMAGREHIEANFSLERVVDQWEALYVELLERKGIKV